MKTVIAGSRSINNYNFLLQAIEDSKINITEIVSGHALGVDLLGEKYALNNGIKLTIFKADWSNIQNCSNPRIGKYGYYDPLAGMKRNKLMSEYSDALIALWDGKSRGTEDIIKRFMSLNKTLFIFRC